MPDGVRILVLNCGDPIDLECEHALRLGVTIWYRVVEAEPPLGPFKTRTAAWYYDFEDSAGDRLLSYHWHPSTQGADKAPHLHVGESLARGPGIALRGVDLPTGRVALEQMVRLAIEEFDVEPIRHDWAEVLTQSESAFQEWRTWS